LEGIDLSIAVPEGLTVLGDEVRLEQVLVNLIGNALDAIAGAPLRRIRITAGGDGRTIHLSIGDSGPGFAPEALPRLFTPFFTTKPPGQGLGLGLVVSKGIVEDMGGTLTLENRPDAETGARFILSLPSAEEPSHG
jgi:two-component system C4-dicarboxylate transport sensor histidine kinase DctB